MSAQDQSQSLTLDGHIIDCSKPIIDGSESVFHAEDDQQSPVAAKYVHTKNATWLQRSFDRTQDLNSQHVIRPIRLLKKSEEIYYLTMDKATSNLQDLLTQQMEKGELLTPKLVFEIFSQIIEGLSALHDADIVHGNLKPSNILLFI